MQFLHPATSKRPRHHQPNQTRQTFLSFAAPAPPLKPPHDTPQSLTTHVSYLTRIRFNLPIARKCIRLNPHLDSPHARAVLVAAVCKFEGPAAGLRELRVSKSDNMQSVHAYTSVIHSHGVRSLSDVVSALVNEAENDHMLQPDIMLYDAAIRAQGRAGKVREAFAMFNTLREKGLEPTEGCFVGLVYACAHGGGGPELGKRAFVAWEAARWHGVAGKLVLGGVASVLLRWNLWNDPRVGRLVREMKACLQRKQQWRTGEAERFEQKLADLERLGGWGEIPDEDKDATAEER